MRGHSGLSRALAMAVGLWAAGCGDAETTPADPGEIVDPGNIGVRPGDEALKTAYLAVQAESATMTVADFMEAYTPEDAPVAAPLSYDPTDSTWFDLIDSGLELTEAERQRIATQGFMVSERLSFPTFGEALIEVYARDLPILVTTDMILQAVHASYDDILMRLEAGVLAAQVGQVLSGAHDALGGVDVGPGALGADARNDADLYLTVARSLLAGVQVPSKGGAAVDGQAKGMLAAIEGRSLTDVTIFGDTRKMDFSQFEPRGHYEGIPELERYFQAMMWLGRVDFRFLEQDEQTGAWVFRLRQLVGAHILRAAVQASGGMTGWSSADDLLTLMVGPVDYIDLRGLDRMADDQGFASPADVATLDEAGRAALATLLLRGDYGEQRINSHWLSTDPFTSEPTPLPPSFALLGQRFVVDSHVFSNVVYDRVVVDGAKIPRVLPNPLDALFVLGQDQALPHLAEELARFPYQGNLNDLRFLVDAYEPSFWSSNLYNLWLDTLRTLNPPTTGTAFPEPMRSPAWRDRVLNTQLGSWAQLRHDTLLYAKQSYTGGVTCQHPDGYVEPYPAFFARVGDIGALASQTLANVPASDTWNPQPLTAFFENWSTVMGRLEVMATKSLQGEAYTADEIAFLKNTINSNPGCGAPVYSGWYSTLYSAGSDAVSDWKPTIADVHTNPNSGPLPGPDVLHVGTGDAQLMVLTAETCEGPEAYVGPVFTYYELDLPEIRRVPDSEWREMLTQGTEPPRPAWTSSFVVPR
ncbi:MAG: DUF3160 domain-containing protein [Deltaproteobacteria bacterium]|nr:DUF3160 domain-containing protein [Deltaproteobacteria bacterium]MCB9786139.1 DUF3160 domain-containing protein [Deltaproteobacteria bacterium]